MITHTDWRLTLNSSRIKCDRAKRTRTKCKNSKWSGTKYTLQLYHKYHSYQPKYEFFHYTVLLWWPSMKTTCSCSPSVYANLKIFFAFFPLSNWRIFYLCKPAMILLVYDFSWTRWTTKPPPSTLYSYGYFFIRRWVSSTEYTEWWPCPLFDILLNKYFPAG